MKPSPLALWVLRGRPKAQTRPITSLEDHVPGLRPRNVMVEVADWSPGSLEPRSDTRSFAGPSDGHQTPIQIGAGQPLIRAGAAKPNLPGGPLKGGRRAGARLQTKSKVGRPNGRAEGYPLNGPGGADLTTYPNPKTLDAESDAGGLVRKCKAHKTPLVARTIDAFSPASNSASDDAVIFSPSMSF